MPMGRLHGALAVQALNQLVHPLLHLLLRRHIRSRAKYLRAKRMVGQDQASVNEILGIASSTSGSATPQALLSGTSTPLAEPAPTRALEEKRTATTDSLPSRSETREVSARPPPTTSGADPSFESGGGMKVSNLSVQEYLTRALMRRKADIVKRKQREERGVWDRAKEVQVSLGAV